MALEVIRENLELPVKTDKIGNYHEGISNSDYHADKEFYSSSQLKNAIDSSASFRYYLENGKDEETAPWTPSVFRAMDYGSLVHALLLEPHVVRDEFEFCKTIGVDFRKKEGKELKAKFLKRVARTKRIPLRDIDLTAAKKAVKATKEHSFAWNLLNNNGYSEYSGYIVEPKTGLKLRIRTDRLSLKDGIVDVKTTESIEKFWQKAKWEFHYDLSAYMYCYVHMLITGEWPVFWFVVIDRKNRVAVYRVLEDSRFMNTGRTKFWNATENVLEAIGNPIEKVRYQEVDFEDAA
tara:strand:- start:13732 stop:14607 length:876 start_codon:yes stop_codon:yes gene_type:complete